MEGEVGNRGLGPDRAARADLDAWCPEVAPSTELRKWFGHDPGRWTEFLGRYEAELADSEPFGELLAQAAHGPVTLVYSARDTEHNQAAALAGFLERRLSR